MPGQNLINLLSPNGLTNEGAFTLAESSKLPVREITELSHGLIKIAGRDIDGQLPLTTPTEPVGVPRETKDLQGISRLANLNGGYVLALQADQDGRRHLRSLKTASL